MGVFEESFESAFGNVAFILWKFSKDIYFFFAVSLTEGEFSCFHVYRVLGGVGSMTSGWMIRNKKVGCSDAN